MQRTRSQGNKPANQTMSSARMLEFPLTLLW